MIRRCPKCSAKNRVPNTRLADIPNCGQCHTPMGYVDRPLPMKTAAEFDALIDQSPLPVLVDYWAAWCGPCRMVAPELEKLAATYAGQLIVAKVDTEALPALAGRYGISGIPTMILFQAGTESQRISGAMPAAQIAERLGMPKP